MRVRITHKSGAATLHIKSSAVNTRTLHPGSTQDIDIGDNEVIVLNAGQTPSVVAIGNHGDKTLLVQVNEQGAHALSPLTFGQRIARKTSEFPIVHGSIVLRCRGARDRDGLLLRESA